MRLRTIGLISTLVLGLLAGPLPAKAQQTGKVYRIAILSPNLVTVTVPGINDIMRAVDGYQIRGLCAAPSLRRTRCAERDE